MIKLYFGNDSFRIKKLIKEESDKDKAETIIFDGDLADLLNSLKSQSFFQEKRIFIVSGKLQKLTPKEINILTLAAKDSGDDSIVFVEEKEPSAKIMEIFKRDGEALQLNDLKGVQLISFIKEKIKEEGADIAPLAAERLAGFVGSDLWQLEEEIKKLVLYKKDSREPIQTADVDLLVHANFEANIFNLVDAIGNKNTKKANKLLNDFAQNGENQIYILTMITRQIRNIAIVKFEKNLSEQQFAKRMGVHPFVAKKTVAQANNFSREDIKELYDKLVWADLRLKSGYEPTQVLQTLVV